MAVDQANLFDRPPPMPATLMGVICPKRQTWKHARSIVNCIQASAGAKPAVTVAMVDASASIPRSHKSGRVVGRGRLMKTTKRMRRSGRKSSPKSPMKARTKEKKVTRARLKL